MEPIFDLLINCQVIEISIFLVKNYVRYLVIGMIRKKALIGYEPHSP